MKNLVFIVLITMSVSSCASNPNFWRDFLQNAGEVLKKGNK